MGSLLVKGVVFCPVLGSVFDPSPIGAGVGVGGRGIFCEDRVGHCPVSWSHGAPAAKLERRHPVCPNRRIQISVLARLWGLVRLSVPEHVAALACEAELPVVCSLFPPLPLLSADVEQTESGSEAHVGRGCEFAGVCPRGDLSSRHGAEHANPDTAPSASGTPTAPLLRMLRAF